MTSRHLYRPLRPWNRKQRGLTLLELLVALAVFAVLGAAAYSGLDSVLAARAALERDSERLRALQLGSEWLRRDLEQAVARPVRDTFGQTRPALLLEPGAELSLQLTRGGHPNPLDRNRSDLLRLGYRLREDTLQRLVALVLDGADMTEAASA
ncbi:MAG: type II secretion system minor pseudopilin GspJ, partial [Candidatus Competibacterales bacterium]|nr:type II secretion system minor pseudopilin GspJ [Candidatus Competibacterales bacterium]